MDDPKRIFDDPGEDPFLRDLVDAGRQVEPTADQLASLAARLPMPGPPGPPGGHGPPGGSTRPPPPLAEAASAGLGPAGWIAGAAGLAAVATLAFVAWPTAGPDDATPPATDPAPILDGPTDEVAPGDETSLGSPRDAPSLGDVEEPGNRPRSRRHRGGRSRSSSRGSTEARAASETNEAPAAPPPTEDVAEGSPAEFELLQRARRLVRNSPAAALRLVEEHRRLYPTGTLSQEREVLAIEALASAGRQSQAQAAARRFSRNYPNSPHRDRIDHALGVQ